ncbi:hypothetical protein F4781DRAFT_412919 [Annulohypoxylon bovei var. microspora]|nr:hypothetical protein F4781DRAFT_412919 [Annulohypoxylon bovei var. microspora]
MGLAGPRNRRKIQNDPNNTKWSRDETTFGQRILRAQGWEPGKFLGAQNSSHSHLHSAASAAPINVLLKDDTLGLGAKPKHKQNAECTGLDVFKDLLGRLNGKSEEVIEKEKVIRLSVKTNLYVERKYGPMRFVSGGLLVGDQMKESTITTPETPSSEKSGDEKPDVMSEDATTLPTKKQKKEKKSKKRKAEDPGSKDNSDTAREKKRKRQSKDEDSLDNSAGSKGVEEPNKKKSKKSKRKDNEETELAAPEKRKKSKKSKRDSEDEAENNGISTIPEDVLMGKSLSKEERRAKRKEKKAKKQKQLETPDSSTEAAGSTDASTPAPFITPQESGASTPIVTGTSTPQGISARHYARSRNIASKRMAMADIAALNQIFMVKPV